MKNLLLISLIVLLTSCSGKKTRLTLLENELRIKLPTSFETIENKTEGFIDFEITIILKFENKEMKEIIKQINNDTLLIKNWKTDTNGFVFEKYSENESEPVYAKLDTRKKILTFSFTHL